MGEIRPFRPMMDDLYRICLVTGAAPIGIKLVGHVYAAPYAAKPEPSY
jgi:hypothetical protein